ncbi:formylglycine-generating sulfatase enzyme [Leptospira santarosai str. CBC379]|uniref:Formylglycine-generating sulfatase enzyme n=1 Tax=Leptospira santarosai str. MOR084 TaxID=1049984 RepID=A0A0E2BCL8_9LEPT|nr:SUMF1/EgtB/PvdO family nonheme iron enzyme [Leptospira santarosai]EKO33107.1 formylglycine-generating sulfatase enzyme [Leptospira santarosai str. MOR084]EKR89652.1 formylglycine-generating sulfatase enzyme [Leptospira santarosai str. CBC379]
MKSKTRNIFLLAMISTVYLGCIYKLLADSPPCKGKEIVGMKCIPAGESTRGSNTYDADERPEEKIYVSDFYMDIYEVTNEEFDKCKNAGKCRECLKTGKCNYIGPRYGKPYLSPKQPVVGISWYTAKEFCEWAGKRLPTEAEWEKAARGPDGNLYPWGNEPATCEKAIIAVGDTKGCVSKKTEKPHLMPTADVGTKAPGVYGLYDMAGNSWEWTADWYSPSFKVCGNACKGKDPKGPCDGKESCPGHSKKVLKSGSWWWPASYARGSKRRAHIPENFPEYHHFGFRCAKDADK